MRMKPIYSQRGLKLAVANIHSLLHEMHVRPWDSKVTEALIDQIDVAWNVALATNRSPHLCIDRYCLCHQFLREQEPPHLPLLW